MLHPKISRLMSPIFKILHLFLQSGVINLLVLKGDYSQSAAWCCKDRTSTKIITKNIQDNGCPLNCRPLVEYTRHRIWCQMIKCNVLFFSDTTWEQVLIRPNKGISNFWGHIYKLLYSDHHSRHQLVFKPPQCFWQFLPSYVLMFGVISFSRRPVHSCSH